MYHSTRLNEGRREKNDQLRHKTRPMFIACFPFLPLTKSYLTTHQSIFYETTESKTASMKFSNSTKLASLLLALTALPPMVTSTDGKLHQKRSARRALRAGRHHGGSHNQVMNEVVHDNKENIHDNEDVLLEKYLEEKNHNAEEDVNSLYDKAFLEADTYEHILEVDASRMYEGGYDDAGDYHNDEMEGDEYGDDFNGRRRMTSSPRLFYLRNKGSGKYLDVANGSCHNGNNIHLWQFNGSNAQKFYWHTNPNGKKYLINAGCHKAIDIYEASCSDGSNIILWTYHGNSNQEFKTYHDLIYNPSCRTAIDNSGKGSHNGNNIQSYRINFTEAQEWEIKYI